MVDKIIKIPKWQFETINNALRLTHRINNCHTKETAFDREVVKAYEYSKSALAEPSSVTQANELSPLVSNRISILSKRIHRLEDMYADICEQYSMWSYQAVRCDKIIKKANDELVALYGC